MLHEENGATPPCAACGAPVAVSRKNGIAWGVWQLLNTFARNLDTMAGNILPLKLVDVQSECARYDDPEGLRKRVLIIETEYLKIARERKK
jgi:hypothetical protein